MAGHNIPELMAEVHRIWVLLGSTGFYEIGVTRFCDSLTREHNLIE